MARYFVSHLTRYRYGRPVTLARHLLHLTPRVTERQKPIAHRISIAPATALRRTGTDVFGNTVQSVEIAQSHAELSVLAESWVEIVERPAFQDSDSIAWEKVRDMLVFRAAHPPAADELDASQFLFESRHVRVKRELALWAQPCFAAGAPLLTGIRKLTERIHADFRFDPDATHVATPVSEVLESRRGVCQDFSHLMLSGLRSLGLAARYVSGYLLTHPPAGKPRLLGADASHAWVSVWCPDAGWVDYDPTNGIAVGDGHVTLGWGRDFADVTPLRGVIQGGDGDEPEIEVSVVPEQDYEALFGTAAP